MNFKIMLKRWIANIATSLGLKKNRYRKRQPVLLHLEDLEQRLVPGGLTNKEYFDSSSYYVNYSAGIATIAVDLRVVNGSGTASVAYATSDGTATAGTNYLPASGTLNFSYSSPGIYQEFFPVPIIDNISGAGDTVNLTLSNAIGAILTSPSTATLTIEAPPVVTAISPTGGPSSGGTSVTIFGNYFSAATAVDFGSLAATSYTVNSSTSITAISPMQSSGTVDVTVTTPDGTSTTSSSDQFTYANAPTVTSVSPSAGPLAGNTNVTITGTDFTGVTSVDFGDVPATSYVVNSATSITATVPAESAGTVDVTVTNSAGTSSNSSNDQFTYLASPTVTAVSPASGYISGGTYVTITGTNFTDATSVDFGATAANSFFVDSPTEITAFDPSAASAGIVDVTVTTPGGTATTSSNDEFTYLPVTPTQWVVMTQPPGTVTAGSAFGLTVMAEDNQGDVDTAYSGTVTLSVENGPGGSLSGQTTATVVDGVATFNSTVLTMAGDYELEAGDGVLQSATTNWIYVEAGAPAALEVAAQPPSMTYVNNGFELSVEAVDQYGNVVPTWEWNTSSITAGVASGPGSLSGPTSTLVYYNTVELLGLSLNEVGSYTLSLNATNDNNNPLTPATTSTINVEPVTPTQWVVTTQPPGTVTAGSAFGLTVMAEDNQGDVDTAYSGTVTLSVENGPGGSLSGQTTATVVDGVATFNSTVLTMAGDYELEAGDGVLQSATTNWIYVEAGAPAALEVAAQPPSMTYVNNGFELSVEAVDQYGNVVPTWEWNTSSITAGVASGPGSLSGPTSTLVYYNTVELLGLSLNEVGSYTLSLNATNDNNNPLTPATTSTINVEPVTPTQWVVTTQPPGTVTAGSAFGLTVMAEDNQGDVDTAYSGTVTLSVENGPGGSLSGQTTATVVDGVATFNSTVLTMAGDYELEAGDGVLQSATTNWIYVEAGAPAALEVAAQPPSMTYVNNGFELSVEAVDQYGNVVPTWEWNTSSITAGVASGPGSLSGPTSTLVYYNTVELLGLSLNEVGSYTLSLNATNDNNNPLTPATTSTINVEPVTPTQWVVTTQPPGTVTAGSAFGLTVMAEDNQGDVDTAYSGTVTLSVENGPGGSLSGQTTATVVDGVATFNSTVLTMAGDYELEAGDGVLQSATTNWIYVEAGAPAALEVAAQPPSMTYVNNGFELSVEAVDQYGNVVPTWEWNTSSITAGVASGPGSLSGPTSTLVYYNTVELLGLSLNEVGSYTLSLNATNDNNNPLTPATTSTINVESAPIVTGNPANQTITYGETAIFTASAIGLPTPTVQWEVSTNDGATFSNLSNGGMYSGVTTDTLTVTGATVAMSGYEYEAVFSNDVGTKATSAATLIVTPANLEVTGITADNKTYDGTTNATLDTSDGQLTGVLNDDQVTLVVSGASANFASKNVGDNISVTVTGLALGGADAGNYTLTQPTGLSADISPATLEIYATSDSKTYDGTTTDTAAPTYQVSGEPLDTLYGNDTLNGLVQVFESKDVLGLDGSTLQVQSGYSVNDGNSGDNYAVYLHTAPGTITPEDVTITATSDSKTYDGGTSSSQTPTVTVGTIYNGEITFSEAFLSKNVLGTDGSTLVVSYTVDDGDGGADYDVSTQAALGTITPKALTYSGLTVPSSKIYDGTGAAVVSGSAMLQMPESPGSGSASDGAPYSGDDVNLTGTATATYNSKDVDTADLVTFIGVTLTGSDSDDYTLTPLTQDATITPKALTYSGLTVPSSKVYDGTEAAVVSGSATLEAAEPYGSGSTSDGAPYSADDVSLTGTPTATYNSKDVDTASYVTFGGLTIVAADSADYTLTASTQDATITPATLTVTPNSPSKVYGSANPSLTYNITGFVDGENDSVVSGVPNLSTSASQSSPVGDYPITATLGTLSAANYTFTFATGDLSITPASLTLNANQQLMLVGGSVPQLTYVYTGLVNGDTSASFAGALATTATSSSPAGSYAITLGTLAATGNYTIDSFNGNVVDVVTASWTSTPLASPVITAPSPSPSTMEGPATVNLQIAATDPNGLAMTYAAINLPPGLSINSSTGLISGVIGYNGFGTYNPTVMVADSSGANASITFSWTVTPTNVAPVITNASNLTTQNNFVNNTVSLPVTATFVDNVTLVYTAVNLPAGLSINSSTGLISGTIVPAAATPGSYTVTVTVTPSFPGGVLGTPASQTFTWNVSPANLPPQEQNPGNQSNSTGTIVGLPIIASAPDGSALTYLATGLPAGLSMDPVTGIISGTIASSAATSSPYLTTVVVTSGLNSTSQSFMWTVTAPNPVSILNPGTQSNVDGDFVSLPFIAADSTGAKITSYTISYVGANGATTGLFNSGFSISNGLLTGTISNTADANGPYQVTVTASDANGSASTTFTWNVAHVGLMNPGAQTSSEGQYVSLQFTGYNADNGAITYSLTSGNLPPGLSLTPSGLISGTISAGAATNSPYIATVTATETVGTTTYTTKKQTFSWTVMPQVNLQAIPAQLSVAGSYVSLAASASDSLGLPLTYTVAGLPTGLTYDPTTGLIYGTIANNASQVNPYQVTITASSGSFSNSETVSWTVVPLYIQPSVQNNNVGDSVSMPISVTDNTRSGPLTYQAVGLPAGLNVDPNTGIISGIIAPGANVNSPYLVIVSADDGTYSTTQTILWNVSGLSLVNPGNQTSSPGVNINLAMTAIDRTGTVLFSALGLPAGLSINANTGVISGTLSSSSASSTPYFVVVNAIDSNGNTASQTFQWTVGPYLTLASTSPSTQVYAAGAPVNQTFTPTYSGNTQNLTYSWSATAGSTTYNLANFGLTLSVSPTTGAATLSGAISSNIAAGTYSVTVSVTDGTITARQTFTWQVVPLLPTTTGSLTNMDGDAVSLPVASLPIAIHGSATGSTITNVTGLPAGLTFNSGMITGTISGTADLQGPYNVKVTVTGTVGGSPITATSTFTWNVNRLSLTVPTNQADEDGQSVALAIGGTGPSGDVLAYSVTGLPLGLYYDQSAGAILGTIAPQADLYSPYVVSVTMYDNAGYATTQNLQWVVTDPVTLSTIVNGQPLPYVRAQNTVEGNAVSLVLSLGNTGGGTLTYGVAGLPPDLSASLSGSTLTISGTPPAGAAGTYQVAVWVSNGTYSTQRVFTWTIARRITITAPPTQFDALGDSVAADLFASATDAVSGSSLEFTLSGQPGGVEIDPSTGQLYGTIDSTDSTRTYDVMLSVYDGTLTESVPFYWQIGRVAVAYTPPQTGRIGDSVDLPMTLDGTPSGTSTLWTATGLPAGLSINATSGLISGTLANTGSWTVVVTATATINNNPVSASRTFAWTVAGPVFLANPGNQTNTDGDAVYLELAGMDPLGGQLTYATGSTLPAGLTLSTSGLISGTLSNTADAQSPYTIDVFAMVNDEVYTSQTFTWTVNHLVLLNPGSQVSVQGQTIQPLQLQALYASGEELVYQLAGNSTLPAGLTLNESSGQITGTPLPGSAGTYSVTVNAYDDLDASIIVSRTFTWTVLPDVIIAAVPNQTSVDGSENTLLVTAFAASQSPNLSYYINEVPGLSISSTGLITANFAADADQNSPYQVDVTVQDNQNGTIYSAMQAFTWTVVPLTLTNPGVQANAAGATITPFSVTADMANPNDNVQYSITGQPSGIQINSSTGQFSGTIAMTAGSAAPYSVTVYAYDYTLGITTSQTFPWVVAPLSVAQPGNQTSTDGTKVYLPIQAVYNPADTMSYSLVNAPSWLSISNTGVITGSVPSNGDVNSPYTVTVIVADQQNPSAAQSTSFTWTVTKPTISLAVPANQTNKAGDNVNLLALAVASNGDAITYSATGLSALGLSINSTTGVISGQISLSAAQTTPYSITITATDSTTSATTSQSFTWMVNPALSLTSPGPQTTIQGASYTLQLAAQSNDEADSISYSETGLPSDFTLSNLTAQISGRGTAADVAHGPYQVTITASQAGVSVSQVFTLTVTSQVTLLNPGPQLSAAGTPALLSLAASDSNSDAGPITYRVTGLPTGLTYNPSDGLISGIVASSASQSKPYQVVVTASDSSGSSSQSFSWLVTPPPQITIIDSGPQRNQIGNFVIVPIAALDPFGGAVSYSATGLPAGLSINPTTGLITGTIAASAGTYSVQINASDGGNSAPTDTFQWTVTTPPTPVPFITNPGPLVSPAGLPVSVTLQAYQPTGSSFTWSITGLPTGMTASGATISGTPTAAGNYVVLACLMNGSTVAATTSFVWQITTAGVAFVPNQTNTEGNTVSLQLQGAGTGLTYSAAGLPGGLTINSQTGLISGTIAPNTAGIYIVDVSAMNGSNGGSQTFTWVVNSAVTLTAINNQISLEGQTVAIQVQASGGSGFTYQAWGLPAGVTINSSTGLISGAPAPGTSIQSGFTVTVKVTNSAGYSNVLGFSWLVNPATTPAAPVESKEPNQTSVAGQVVNLNLNSFDPAGYSYIEAINNLPDGLSLNAATGAITGIVADDAVNPVPYNVSVVLGDGLGNSVTERFKWSVEPTTLTAQVYPINATAGTSTGTITIGTFATTDLVATASEFIVAINWGDGLTSLGTVSGGLGSFTITASHNYVAAGLLPVSVTITNLDGAMPLASVYGTANVATSTLTLTAGFQLGALVGQETSLMVAYFTLASPFRPGQLTAVINWGDASDPTNGTITPLGNGLYQVSGTYSYAAIGTYTVTVNVSGAGMVAQPQTSTVVVGNLFAGINGQLDLGTITVSPSTTYTVTVNWGDGVDGAQDTTTYNVTTLANQTTLTLSPTHSFNVDSFDQANSVYQVQITVTGSGSTLSTTVPVEVTRPPEFMVVANVAAKAGTVLTNQVMAIFSDPDAADGDAEFDASINWGDGSTSNGIACVSVGANSGLFEVVASHSYTQAPTGSFSVTTSQAWQEKQPNKMATGTLLEQAARFRKAADTIHASIPQEEWNRYFEALGGIIDAKKQEHLDTLGTAELFPQMRPLQSKQIANANKDLIAKLTPVFDQEIGLRQAAKILEKTDVLHKKALEIEKQQQQFQKLQGDASELQRKSTLERTIWLDGGESSGGKRVQIYRKNDGSLFTVYQNVSYSKDIPSLIERESKSVEHNTTSHIGGFPKSVSVDQAEKFVRDTYGASHTWFHYFGKEATWIPLWGTAIKVSDGDWEGAVFSFIGDVDTVLMVVSIGKAGAKILIQMNRRSGAARVISAGSEEIVARGLRSLPVVRSSFSSCFVAGTMLLTPDGEKPIEQFRRGDLILARSETGVSHPVEPRLVEETFVRVAPILAITVNGREIWTTHEHPFYVRNKGWLCASELKPGHELSTHDGEWVKVEAVVDLKKVETVYNLRVAEHHTYFVGSGEWGFSVWAHNANYVLVPHGNGFRLAEQIEENVFRLVTDATGKEIKHFASEALARQAVASGGGAIIAGPRTAAAEALANALRGYQSQRFTVGSHTFQLDRSAMQHILEGHHPNFFNGEFGRTQAFLPRSTTTGQIESMVEQILTQNRDRVIAIGAGQDNVFGIIGGVRYQITLDAGRVVRFFPVVP